MNAPERPCKPVNLDLPPNRSSAEQPEACDPSTQKVPDRKPAGVGWSSYTEARIREAQDQGAFENLPGFGKPIPGIGGMDDEDWWLKDRARRDGINLLPPALEIRLDVERTLQRIADLAYEIDVRRAVRELNGRIAQAQRAALWGPPCDTQPLDEEQAVTRWRESRGD